MMYDPKQLIIHPGNFLIPTNETEYWKVRSYLAEKALVASGIQLIAPGEDHKKDCIKASIELQKFIDFENKI